MVHIYLKYLIDYFEVSFSSIWVFKEYLDVYLYYINFNQLLRDKIINFIIVI